MKLCGVEIPADIEIPPLDTATKAELDQVLAAIACRYQGVKQRCPDAPASDQALAFSIDGLRQLPPEARARILYGLREHVTD